MDVYLDNNATTAPLPEISIALEELFSNNYANPSSLHIPGRKARAKIEQARETIARLLGCRIPSEIIFTSGGTESISTVFAEVCGNGELPAIISKVEHDAVRLAAQAYAKKVYEVGVNSDGHLSLEQLEECLKRHAENGIAPMVSLMSANHETGVIDPLEEIGSMVKSYGAVFHIDAVQAAGKIPLNIESLHCDFLSLSAHKFHGLKGTGALFIKNSRLKRPLIIGHQEHGYRGGTENAIGIIAMGIAADSILLAEDVKQIAKLRDRLEREICSRTRRCLVNGDRANRLANTTNITFANKDGAMLVEALSNRGVYVSTGAACSSGGEPSRVLQAMGISQENANSSIRFSLSRYSTDQEIEYAADTIESTISSLPDISNVS